MTAADHLYDIAIFSSCVGDGGPLRYRDREIPLPEKYLPGRFWQGLGQSTKDSILKGIHSEPAPWVLKILVDDAPARDSFWHGEFRKYERVLLPRGDNGR